MDAATLAKALQLVSEGRSKEETAVMARANDLFKAGSEKSSGPKSSKVKMSLTDGHSRAFMDSDMILLDNCAQDTIIKDIELLTDLKKCGINISLDGFVPGNKKVLSQGCGKLGIPAYYCPEATANLISWSQLLKLGFQIRTIDNGFKIEVLDEAGVAVMRGRIDDGVCVIEWMKSAIISPNSQCNCSKSSLVCVDCDDGVDLVEDYLNSFIQCLDDEGDGDENLTEVIDEGTSPSVMDMCLSIVFGQENQSAVSARSSVGLIGKTKRKFRGQEVVKLYENLGKLSIQAFKDMVRNGAIVGTTIGVKDIEVNQDLLDPEGAKAIATMHRINPKHSVNPSVASIGELVNTDIIFDEYNSPYLHTEDRFSKLRTIAMLKTKSGSEILTALTNVASTNLRGQNLQNQANSLRLRSSVSIYELSNGKEWNLHATNCFW
jgi:hypothetical protein